MIAKIKELLNYWGYVLVRKEMYLKHLESKFYNNLRLGLMPDNEEIVSVVFSKDRAMQLHAFICSYFEQIENCSNLIVLYKSSSSDHKNSYTELIEMFRKHPVQFIEEVSFKEQFTKILGSQSADRLLLYVDDIIITHPFDYNVLKKINPYKTILSLSRGLDMTYSTVLLKNLRQPKFEQIDNGLYKFKWNEIKEFSDWSFPLGVSAYMFATKEFLAMVNTLNFKAPNSLEESMQFFLSNFKDRDGVCTKNSIAVCVHANLTQTEGVNPILGRFSIEDLLDKWNQGLCINRQKFYHVPMSIVQEQDYEFIKR